jgi:hypothetical protein
VQREFVLGRYGKGVEICVLSGIESVSGGAAVLFNENIS